MSALPDDRRLEICLRDLESLHGPIVRDQEIVDSYSYSWYQDEYTQGAFALFGPAQFSTHFQGCVEEAEDGRLHFAGEATSVHHAWVVGALNSAHRTVAEILMTLPPGDRHYYLTKLCDNWGTVDEIEIDEPGLWPKDEGHHEPDSKMNGNGSDKKELPDSDESNPAHGA